MKLNEGGIFVRIFWTVPVMLLLCGCFDTANQPGRGELFVSQDDLAAKDDAICRQYGAKPGEAAYVQCRVEQDKRRDEFKFGAGQALRSR